MIDTRHAEGASRAVSAPGVNVRGMSAHVCTWFEDAWPDHVCDCGARAVLVVDELGETSFALLDEPVAAAPQLLSA